MGAVLEELAELVNGNERGPFLMRQWRFAVRASAEAWRRFWESVPAPGYHDLFAWRGWATFPMSENPDRFRGYILPVLDEIRALK